MARIESRLEALERWAAQRAPNDDDLARRVVAWMTDVELVSVVHMLEESPGPDWCESDRRVLEILQAADARRQEYGSLEAWQESEIYRTMSTLDTMRKKPND